jgi:hypothetical protein
MLYVAHLAFTSPDPEAAHGYVTTAIEADSVDAAIAGTRAHLLRLQDERALFSPGTEVTVASCIEIRKPSRDGFVLQFWRLPGRDFTEVSTTLPDAADDQAAAFQWQSEISSEPEPLVHMDMAGAPANGAGSARDGP